MRRRMLTGNIYFFSRNQSSLRVSREMGSLLRFPTVSADFSPPFGVVANEKEEVVMSFC